ncbi:TetR/AcrR family transcriptional regulator [Paenibacillus arenilitoris]|uniref:TetR/AcrR family transcriptional regulator n=1 Tax=Paenibacillus arenilitoris TaxID=2772299 RepID=A0A927CIX8_9BACL|nr:TetR/AcrR family transcriptional regulator [Paenibacillus arenilitoris]MBD2868320.1 TetR/AcrR family transcriptional regulator [Paenibacillus arenilitoris]
MKDRIAEAVVQEILQRGLRFSIRDVAGALGVSTKTIYQHFESKEQIVAYLVEQAVNEMRECERDIMADPELSTKQKLFEVLVTIPKGYAFGDLRSLLELKQMFPRQWAVMDEYLQMGWDNFRLLVERGREEEVLRPFDPEVFIGMYVGALNHFMDARSAVGRRKPLDRVLREMVGLLLQGVYTDRDGGPAASEEGETK